MGNRRFLRATSGNFCDASNSGGAGALGGDHRQAETPGERTILDGAHHRAHMAGGEETMPAIAPLQEYPHGFLSPTTHLAVA